MDGQTEFQRFELKYLIDEQTAGRIRQDVLALCEPDRAEGGGYPITTLYLDTPTLAFHRAKLEDAPDRLKLRARGYGRGGDVYLELKRKRMDVVSKRRIRVAGERWAEAAQGSGEPLDGRSARARALLDDFAAIRTRYAASPRLLVEYTREAYASSVDRYARVTFDRDLRVQEQREWSLEGCPSRWLPLHDAFVGRGAHAPVVLELKCEPLMPRWLVGIIQRHQLRYQGFSKYSHGILLSQSLTLAGVA